MTTNTQRGVHRRITYPNVCFVYLMADKTIRPRRGNIILDSCSPYTVSPRPQPHTPVANEIRNGPTLFRVPIASRSIRRRRYANFDGRKIVGIVRRSFTVQLTKGCGECCIIWLHRGELWHTIRQRDASPGYLRFFRGGGRGSEPKSAVSKYQIVKAILDYFQLDTVMYFFVMDDF